MNNPWEFRERLQLAQCNCLWRWISSLNSAKIAAAAEKPMAVHFDLLTLSSATFHPIRWNPGGDNELIIINPPGRPGRIGAFRWEWMHGSIQIRTCSTRAWYGKFPETFPYDLHNENGAIIYRNAFLNVASAAVSIRHSIRRSRNENGRIIWMILYKSMIWKIMENTIASIKSSKR